MNVAGDCQHGHESHALKRLQVRLDGQPMVHEWPPFLNPLTASWTMLVWDWRAHRGLGGYCPAQDIVSEGIEANGVWEGPATLLALDLLRGGAPADQTVLDYGAQLGWYSLLAASQGYSVTAFDAEAENVRALRAARDINGWDGRVAVWHEKVGGGYLDRRFDNDRVRLLKADVEGAEPVIIAHHREHIAKGAVDAALVECSPCFHEGYLSMLRTLDDLGMNIYRVPEKDIPTSEHDAFASAPLAWTMEHCALPPSEFAVALEGSHQFDVLALRRGLL